MLQNKLRIERCPLKKAIEEIRQFNIDRDWDQFHTPENLAKSISIEAGELLECFQWNAEYDRQAVLDELADVMNYCLVLCDRMEADPETILLEKLEKNKQKYPLDKCRGKSTKYDKLDQD